DMVFVTAGLGGGTGTGAAPVVAELAKQQGALTVAIVTLPFEFEGKHRHTRAMQGLAELRTKVDTLICIRNQRLLSIVDKTTRLTDAFNVCDEILHQATKGIADLITVPGLINCDFADVRTVMREMGDAIMGTGRADGEGKSKEAARAAIHSPLLEDVSIVGARGVLVNITGGMDLALHDVHEATTIISEAAGDDANVIFGAVIDPRLDDEIRVTVIATGFGAHQETPQEPEVEETLPLPKSSRTRTPGGMIDMFGTERTNVGTNRIRGLAMGETDALRQPQLADDDPDNLEVPAFVRKHMVRSATETDNGDTDE
ncbi:MAG: cell division protein FtsZ, partial [candidate division Zixibacteria bacterium]|nr:cell division protein FtsZ [candidate division Zixibacteria bacterium]